MVYALLADGFEEIEAITVIDILKRADIGVKTFAVSDIQTVCGAHGIKVIADDIIENIDFNFDVIFLPGGYPGYVNLENNDMVINIIREANSSDKLISAICAAPSVLGKMGILNGKKACCFPSFEEYLTGADVCFEDVCTDGNIITSRGAGTAHILGFELVKILKGKEIAENLKTAMIYRLQ